MTVYTAVRPTTDCGPRVGGQKPNIVVLHHTAGVMSVDALVSMMMPGGRTVSAHAAIKDRDIVNVVPESKRAFALADAAFDSRALNAECINSTGGPNWQLSDQTHESIARWVADVCKRHDIKPHRSGPAKTWTVIGHREVYTIHKAGYATACPGGMRLDWIVNRAQEILKTAPPKKKDKKMSQGAFYRNETSGAVYWQEKPNTALIHIEMATWRAYMLQGNEHLNLPAAEVEDLIKKWGTAKAPTTCGGGTGATPDQIADELADRLKD